MIYNFSLWNDCDLNPDQFKKQMTTFDDNSTVNIFAAEEYEIKLGYGQRGWEIINELKTNINWNFVFGSADAPYYLGRYQDEWTNKSTHLWPTFFINRSFYYLKDKNFKEKDNINYLFLSMMNLPREHRCFLMDGIFKYNFQQMSALTWHYTTTEYDWKYWIPQKLMLTDVLFSKVHYENQVNENFVSSIHTLPNEFSQSLFSLVSESSVNRIFITEKTAIPLIMGQPFIVQGAPGFHSYLKDLGFELYTELFDYTFDRQIDYKKRTESILENINSLKDKDWKSLYSLVYEKTLRNKDRAIKIAQDRNFVPAIILNNDYANNIYSKELSSLQNKW
jgi:hypothetical protein